MDFDQLTTFLEVARQGSFSRAGEKVFRSQSAVSAQIRQLEQEYGDRLLDRSGKTVKLTPAGQVFYEYAERMKNLRDESLMAVADHSGTPRGTLRVGANEATARTSCPKYLPKFSAHSPPCRSAFTGISATRSSRSWRTGRSKWASSRCRSNRPASRFSPFFATN